MRAPPLALLALLLLAGCASPTAERPPSVPRAQVAVEGFHYDDTGCSDTIPFSFLVANLGSVDAAAVQVVVESAGHPSYNQTVGTIAARGTFRVHGSVQAHDDCDKPNAVRLVLRIKPSNGPEFQLGAVASI
jgi:hypothetical protein